MPDAQKEISQPLLLAIVGERLICPKCNSDLCGIFKVFEERSGMFIKLLDMGGLVVDHMDGECKSCRQPIYWNVSHQKRDRLLQSIAAMRMHTEETAKNL